MRARSYLLPAGQSEISDNKPAREIRHRRSRGRQRAYRRRRPARTDRGDRPRMAEARSHSRIGEPRGCVPRRSFSFRRFRHAALQPGEQEAGPRPPGCGARPFRQRAGARRRMRPGPGADRLRKAAHHRQGGRHRSVGREGSFEQQSGCDARQRRGGRRRRRRSKPGTSQACNSPMQVSTPSSR